MRRVTDPAAPVRTPGLCPERRSRDCDCNYSIDYAAPAERPDA